MNKCPWCGRVSCWGDVGEPCMWCGKGEGADYFTEGTDTISITFTTNSLGEEE